LKLSPTERRILYRANNAKTKAKLTAVGDILDYVKESFKNVSPEKLMGIMTAASGVASLDKKIDDTELTIGDMISNNDPTPEETFLSRELMTKMNHAVANIPLIEMKVIKMKFGVEQKIP
ncbi:MAG: hypothetical protein DRN30_04180, partial [Thermoplasmata archaeon]